MNYSLAFELTVWASFFVLLYIGIDKSIKENEND